MNLPDCLRVVNLPYEEQGGGNRAYGYSFVYSVDLLHAAYMWLRVYIKGCCRHHPGVPVFHDALKGWSCCSRRSTDFTEFLNIPGCTNGRHSNEKPPEPEKKQAAEVDSSEVVRFVKHDYVFLYPFCLFVDKCT